MCCVQAFEYRLKEILKRALKKNQNIQYFKVNNVEKKTHNVVHEEIVDRKKHSVLHFFAVCPSDDS